MQPSPKLTLVPKTLEPKLFERHEIDISAVVVCRGDEELAGHQIRRIDAHFKALGLRSEIIAVDESSSDNTVPLLCLLRNELPALRVVAGVASGRGYVRGAGEARGPILLIMDARSDAPLSALGFALSRIASGLDGMAVHGRYLVLRRVRNLDAFDALVHRRDPAELHRRYLRRARILGLRTDVAASNSTRLAPLRRLRDALLMPLASRAWW